MANLGLKMQEKILKRQFSDSLWGGIEKSGRGRYRSGFPAAEETKHRGRDTGQNRRAYSSFFSAEDCAQYL